MLSCMKYIVHVCSTVLDVVHGRLMGRSVYVLLEGA